MRSGDGQLPEQLGVKLVARRRVRRGGTPIARRDPHLLQQRGDMEAAHLLACLPEQGAQPPAAGKGILQVQRIHPAHQRQIGRGRRPALGVDAAPTDPKQPGLTADTQTVLAVDHRLALGNKPALLSAPSQQSSQGSVARSSHAARSRRSPIRPPASPAVEDLWHACQPLLLPLLDLVRMHVELLGEFCQCLFPRMAASATEVARFP